MALCASSFYTHTMTISLSIILAVLLDYWLGEPRRYHPLVYFGTGASRLEKLCHRFKLPVQQKLSGALAYLILTCPLPVLILFMPVGDIIGGVVLYFCIGAKSLKQHSVAVFDALQNNDMAQARKKVALIVSRDTRRMNQKQVRQAAIESVLENGADAVFAPVFWFIVAGPAGAVFYRLTNTLDAMWGYKSKRYFYFGRVAARMDDVLNWLPARLTALSYALSGQTGNALACWYRQAYQLESPNAGPVMTAGAGALNIQLGGAAYYQGKLKDKISFGGDNTVCNADIIRANRLIDNSLTLWLGMIVLGEYLA